MTTRKTPGWIERLNLWLMATEHTPFVWGRHDCCLFAADGVEVLTGWDAMADLRGKYDSERGAYRLIAAAGGLDRLVTERMGPAIATTLAQRGDVVMVHQGDRELLALCLGPMWAAAGTDGRVLGPMTAAAAAWSV